VGRSRAAASVPRHAHMSIKSSFARVDGQNEAQKNEARRRGDCRPGRKVHHTIYAPVGQTLARVSARVHTYVQREGGRERERERERGGRVFRPGGSAG
jgi:hypothetical protein